MAVIYFVGWGEGCGYVLFCVGVGGGCVFCGGRSLGDGDGGKGKCGLICFVVCIAFHSLLRVF